MAEPVQVSQPTHTHHDPGSGWTLFWGICLLVAGFLSIAAPYIAGLTTQLFLGWLFVLGGMTQIFSAFSHRHERHFWAALVGALAALAVGGLMLVFPLASLVGMTLLIGGSYLAVGVWRILLALDLRPAFHWGWILAGGILDAILGLFVILAWPLSALWAIGILVGFHFISMGIVVLLMVPRLRLLRTV